MDDHANALAAWSLQGTIGVLNAGALAGRLDVARPHAGLHHAAFDYEREACLLFCTRRSFESSGADATWPLPVADSYVRGNDLVAAYRPTDDWPYSPQLYWQAKTLQSVDGVLASLSHLVSVQTHLLDTYPKITVASQVPSSEVLYIALGEGGQADVEPADRATTITPTGSTCCVLRRLLAAPFSYVEIVSAADVRNIVFPAGAKGRMDAEWRVFADFLEKGVIRRARIHGALLPRENDIELAVECCRAMEHSPLPLTT